ncbi:MAG: 50S ribosomal protein L23 [Mycoplasmoidaceae bacterium]
MNLSEVIIKPYNTEKTYLMNSFDKKKYCFIVNKKATKKLIQEAFQAIYGIKCEKVNIVNKIEKKTKTGTRKPGFKKAKKIAIITLLPGTEIVFDEEEKKE